MEAILTLLLIRFAVIAAVVVLLVLGVVSVVAVMRRRGRRTPSNEQLVRAGRTVYDAVRGSRRM